MNSKKESRQAVRLEGMRFTADERAAESGALCSAVLAEPHFIEARTVALFSSLPDEVQTSEIIRKALVSKRVALPVVEGREMYFRLLTGENDTRPGEFGIQEPCGEICPPEQIDFILVPGVAFDVLGNRMGRGRGYYDRYLAGCGAFKAGICFSYQLIASVPHQEHDIKMDTVIHP